MRRLSWLSLLLVLAMVVACGKPAAKSPEPSAPTASQPATPQTPAQTVNVTLAPGPKGGVLWLSEMVAEGIGAFKNKGINLTVLPTTGGTDAVKALMNGDADFALLAFDHVLKNRAQGADLMVVMFLTRDPGLVMIVRSDLADSVKSIKDLKGQKVAVSSIGGGTHMAVLGLMAQAGMQPGDIEIVAAKDGLAPLWDSKAVAAAMHVDPQITDLVGNNRAKILYDLRGDKDTLALYGTEYPLGTLVTRQDVIDKKPELVQNMVQAIADANAYIKSHSASEIAAVVPADYKANDPLYDSMVGPNSAGLSFTGKVTQAGLDTVIKQLRDNKAIPADSNVTIANSVNLTFVDKIK